MDLIPTIEDIVAHALALKPAVAASVMGGEAAALCTTLVYTQVRDGDGTVINLDKVGGKIGAGYARVSSVSQRTSDGKQDAKQAEIKDGWSEQDQIQRIVGHFVSKRQAFRIFSDCGLSGGLPFNDDRLKEKMLRARARRYERMFERIFLSGPAFEKRSPAEVDSLRRHLAEKKERLLTAIDDDLAPDDLERMQVIEPLPRRKRFTVTHRPALTLLMQAMPEIHTLAVTDISRLSRSQTLSAEIGEKIIEQKVAVVGLIENLDWMNSDEEIGNQLMALLIPKFAEHRLTEVLMNAMRGIVTMLESGRPHGTLNSWLKRDAAGFAHIVEEKAAPVRRLIEIFLDDNTASTRQACGLLIKEGFPPPVGRLWHCHTVKTLLESPALIGKQHYFGLEWSVFDPLIDEATYARIQKKRAKLRETFPAYAPKEGRNIAAYLLKCSCGAPMAYKKRANGIEQIKCNRALHEFGTDGGIHVTLSASNVVAFLDALIMEHPRVVLNAFRDSHERAALLGQLEETEAAIRRSEKDIRDKEAAAREEVRRSLHALRIDETNPLFTQSVAQLSSALLVDAYQELERLKDREQDISYRIDTLVPQDVVTTIEQRAGAWADLNNHQKNNLILSFFKEWRVEGEPPNEVIVPVLRNGSEDTLYPISIRYSGTKLVRRRMPTVNEYLAEVQAGIGL